METVVSTSHRELREYYVLYEILDGGVLRERSRSFLRSSEEDAMVQFKDYMDSSYEEDKVFTVLKTYEPVRNYA